MNHLSFARSTSVGIVPLCGRFACAAALCFGPPRVPASELPGLRLGVETVGAGDLTSVRITGQVGQRLVLEATTNFSQSWPVFTNDAGGVPFAYETPLNQSPRRFFRGLVEPTSLVLVRGTAAGGVVLR